MRVKLSALQGFATPQLAQVVNQAEDAKSEHTVVLLSNRLELKLKPQDFELLSTVHLKVKNTGEIGVLQDVHFDHGDERAIASLQAVA